LRFLLANVSDFNPATDAVPIDQMLEIDRYALAETMQLHYDIKAKYNNYEFHPVVAKIQIYCSEYLGGFYLDVLKDRLYTTAPKSIARRSAQTALWNMTNALLRWIAPFLSFTAEEAWKIFGTSESIFMQEYSEVEGWFVTIGPKSIAHSQLLAKWARIRDIRDIVNKEIENLRADGKVGSSLQANITLTAGAEDHALMAALGDDLKFVFITSAVTLQAGNELAVSVTPSTAVKCERCWHYRDDVGADAAHPTICGRCTSNLYGAGETRTFA
jgi:isoleucyl-tRNA synthetase